MITPQSNTLRALLANNNQLEVPRYQRHYTWKRQHWLDLWNDVLARYQAMRVEPESPDAKRKHFLGAFVLMPAGEPDPLGFQKFAIIDGQQRLLTLEILLAAIRDTLTSPTDQTWWTITGQFLAHTDARNIKDLRIVPGSQDFGHFDQLIRGKPPQASEGQVARAYHFFLEQLLDGFRPELIADEADEDAVEEGEEPQSGIDAPTELSVVANGKDDSGPGDQFDLNTLLTAVLDRLEYVVIQLTGEENPYQVFQTLNARGTDLTQVDLLRSAFFVLVPKYADELFESVWNPMETRLGATGLQNFFLTDLIRQGNNIPSQDIFVTLDRMLRRGGLEEVKIRQLLSDVGERAGIYAIVHSGDTGSTAIPSLSKGTLRSLADLREWGFLPAQPLILEALLQLKEGRIDDGQLAALSKVLLSFLVRRFLVGVPPNGLRSLFALLMQKYVREQVGTVNVDWLRKELSQQSRRWPNDEVLKKALADVPLYTMGKTRQVFFILRRLAESMEPLEGMPAIALGQAKGSYSIEHVLPNGTGLTESWRNDLNEWNDEQPDLTWQNHRHQLGNLTLTIYNPELGNSTWSQKRTFLQEHAGLEMNRDLMRRERWTRTEIIGRTNELVARAAAIWQPPLDV